MSTDSNIPILGQIAATIKPDKENYNNRLDYYGSPVHTALEPGLEDNSWPQIRQEYLFDKTGQLMPFPHNYRLPDAKKRDLPITFFYEIIRLLQHTEINKKAFPEQCVNYYNANFTGCSAKVMRNHARRIFFHCYAFLLGQEIIKNNITIDQLKPISSGLPSEKSITKVQHDSYMKTAYEKYCKSSRELFDGNTALRFSDQEKFNKNPILSGPRFMTNIFGLTFSYDVANKKATRLKMDTGVDFRNEDFLKETQHEETKEKKELDFEKGGCKSAAALFIFCAAAERTLLEKRCCSPLAKEEEIFRTDLLNLILKGATMLGIQRIQQIRDEIIEAIRNEKDDPVTRDGSTTRFLASSLSDVSDIRVFINQRPPKEPDSVHEFRSLHIVIPNESCNFPESVIELKFHFFDMNKKELSFHYIESYDCKDQSKKLSDGYYFMPGSDNSLSEIDYLSCAVKVGTAFDPNDETTAHVVAVLYQP